MSGCQTCWDLAYLRMVTRGGAQADHYRDLLRENDGDPSHARTPRDEQDTP
jgi:hypothetical protein